MLAFRGGFPKGLTPANQPRRPRIPGPSPAAGRGGKKSTATIESCARTGEFFCAPLEKPAESARIRHERVSIHSRICSNLHRDAKYVRLAMTNARNDARIGPFCATRDFVREFSVSQQCVKAFGDSRTISATHLRGTKPRGRGNASAGAYRGSGEKCRSQRIRRNFKSCA
jgi:hypothetical protein